mgnify:CR=1 FL=1
MANNINAAAKAWVISQLAQIGILATAANKGIVATLPNGAVRKIQVAARSNDDHAAGVGPIKELDFEFYVVVPVKKGGIEWGFVFSRDEIADAPLNSDAMSNHAFSRDPKSLIRN